MSQGTTAERRRRGGLEWIGSGSVGGKGRGLGFLTTLLSEDECARLFAPHRVHIPPVDVIATEEFELFVAAGGLSSCIEEADDAVVRRRFLAAALRPELRSALTEYLAAHHRPIAVRSSSLHEDDFYLPLAGLFSTWVIPNSHPDPAVRLRQLEEAVKLVYASTWFERPKRALTRLGISPESELMAIVLQELVGADHDGLFYPHVTGVMQSLNFFAVGPLRPEDGVALIVMGLDSQMVRGDRSMRFCPRHPFVRPQIYTDRDLLRLTQRDVLVVDLGQGGAHLTGADGVTLRAIPVEATEAHGTLRLLASTWSDEDQTLYDGTYRRGRRVLTFNGLLRGDRVPLGPLLTFLKERFEAGFNGPVVFKFALTLTETAAGPVGDLFLLQVRPMVTEEAAEPVALPDVPPERLLVRSSQALGNGRRVDLRHVVYVPPEAFDPRQAAALAAAVQRLNRRLEDRDLPYVLIGPGRWGSVNRSLGIPVTFEQIAGARVVVELAGELAGGGAPSQGTHFFQDVAAQHVFYLAVDPRADDVFRAEALEGRPDVGDGAPVRLIELDTPLTAAIDGRARRALVYFEG